MRSKLPIVVAITATLALGASFFSASSPAAAASKCTPFTFIGLRGNGQTFSTGSPVREMGKEIAAVYAATAAQTPFKNKIRYSGVPKFKAAAKAYGPGYIQESQNAGASLAAFLPTFDQQLGCKTPTRYVLAGYSQGAYEIRAGIRTLAKSTKNAALLKRVAAVVLVGDPARETTGILRLGSSNIVTLATKQALQWSGDTCFEISAKSWPYPDCTLGEYVDKSSSQFPKYQATSRKVLHPDTGAVMGVVAFQGVLGGVVSDVLNRWTSLSTMSVAPLPSRPTFSYDMPGDGVSRATDVIAAQYPPFVDAARAIYTNLNYDGPRYTDTVAALDTAFNILEQAKQVHNSYAATPVMAQSAATWLSKTVK